jgi:hypothetical protein
MKMTRLYVTIAKEEEGNQTRPARLRAPQYLFLNPEEAKISFGEFKDKDYFGHLDWKDSLSDLLEAMFADNRDLVFNMENSQNPTTAFIGNFLGHGTVIYRPLSIQEYRTLTELSIKRSYQKFGHQVDRSGRVWR